MSAKRLLVAMATVVMLIGLGVAGYALGQANTASKDEARQVQRRAFNIAFSASEDRGRRIGVARGSAKGQREGRAAGRRAGRRRGLAAGQTAGDQGRQQQTDAAEQQQQIDANAKERNRNCNAPLFADGSCPTDEEVQQENDAESLCGPGTEEGREKAARQGVDC